MGNPMSKGVAIKGTHKENSCIKPQINFYA